MSDIAIALDGVTKTFPGSAAPAVQPLTLDINEGEIVVLIGPSGCGKTTTLRMINRLIEPTAGTITVDGVDIRDRPVNELRRGIGYVIQQIGLFPHRTIASNIATVPVLLGWGRDAVRERVAELASLVGLDPDLLDRYPAELSGGQQQRVGVARALAADPPVLLMDEPFGAVDPIVRGRLQRELLDLQARLHKTIVLVTHDIDEAITLGDRVAVLNVGGVLEQYAEPDELLAAPANPFVESFLGAERSIKRLSRGRVRDLALVGGPVVPVAASPADARTVATEQGTDWLGLLDDGGRILGWAEVVDLVDLPDLRGAAARPLVAKVGPDSTQREALEVILNSRSEVALVVDGDGSYVGAVTLDAIRRSLDRGAG